jgi:hypothetical protein
MDPEPRKEKSIFEKILFSSPVPDEEEEEDPWEDKTAEITFGGGQAAVTKVSTMEEIPPNAHISTPFFRKQCFSLKYSLVSPPPNF